MTSCDLYRCPNEVAGERNGLSFCQRHLDFCTCGDALVGTEEFGFDCLSCCEDISPFLEAWADATPLLVGSEAAS